MEHDKEKAPPFENDKQSSQNPAATNEISVAKLHEPAEVISLRSWERSENHQEFHVEYDNRQRTVSVEGWLQHRSGERPSADRRIQNDFRTENGLNQDQHAFHVIAYSHGGPCTDTHSVDQVKSNLIAADSLINMSYHTSLENRISSDLSQGRQIYCKATISYGSDASRSALPQYVSYAYYVKNQAGEPEEYVIKEYLVRVDHTPGLEKRTGNSNSKEGVRLTAAEMLKRERAREFYNHEWTEQLLSRLADWHLVDKFFCCSRDAFLHFSEVTRLHNLRYDSLPTWRMHDLYMSASRSTFAKGVSPYR